MPRIVIKTIKSKQRKAAWDYFKPEIDRAMDGHIKPKLIEYCMRIVSRWRGDKPTFKARKIVTPNYWAVDVWPGAGKGADKWRWASGGTRKRRIVPKKPGGVLVFRADYQPITRGGGQYRGPGKATGELVFTRLVKNHRIKPRNFEKTILRWYRQSKHFLRTMENAVKRGVRAYNRDMSRTVMK